MPCSSFLSASVLCHCVRQGRALDGPTVSPGKWHFLCSYAPIPQPRPKGKDPKWRLGKTGKQEILSTVRFAYGWLVDFEHSSLFLTSISGHSNHIYLLNVQ